MKSSVNKKIIANIADTMPRAYKFSTKLPTAIQKYAQVHTNINATFPFKYPISVERIMPTITV
jgi:hypothetical protein